MQRSQEKNVSFRRVLLAIRDLVRPMRGWFWLVWAAIILANIFEVLRPWAYKRFFDLLSLGVTDTQPLVQALLGIFVLYGFSWLMYQLAPLINDRFEPEVKARAISASFAKLFEQSMGFFGRTHTGSLTQRIRRFSESISNLLDIFQWDVLPAVVLFVGSLGSVFLRSKPLACIVLGWIMLYVVVNILFSRWKLRYDNIRSKKDSEVTAMLSDAFSHYPAVIAHAAEERERARLQETLAGWRKIQTFTWVLGTFSGAIQWALAIILEMGIFFVAIRFWQSGTLTVGDFALLQSVLLSIFFQVNGLGRTIRTAYESVAGAGEMIEVFDAVPDIVDAPMALPLKVKDGSIVFDRVTFSYTSSRTALKDFSLTIPAGERVAFVGPSGAGKSTIIKLLLRFSQVSAGSIRIDGQPIDQVTRQSLRASIAFVPQEPALFHRSVYENILYGKPDATEKEVHEAARLAHCMDFIERLPEGFSTHVGERGVHLSGGERQRIALARAILKNAPILVLDEATASLDSASEGAIQEALREVMKGRTTIVIAHRLSTILAMDRIVVIKGGSVAEEGSHKELLEKDGLYAKLWNLQSSGFLS